MKKRPTLSILVEIPNVKMDREEVKNIMIEGFEFQIKVKRDMDKMCVTITPKVLDEVEEFLSGL